MILIMLKLTTAFQRLHHVNAVLEFHVLLIVCFVMPECEQDDAYMVFAIIVSIYPSCT